MFDAIPTERPSTPLLDGIDSPKQLRALPKRQLPKLAEELRAFLLYSVGRSGGHLGASLGVIELTIALHYLYDTPHDRLVWDVGHQAYPHKILTSRRERMDSLRRAGGLSGFPKRDESPYDTFGAGHSSTSVSAALGMALAAARIAANKDDAPPPRSVAIIGDGGMTAGMAYEAIAHAGSLHTDMLIVLNDNQMSISRNTGGLHNYFARIWSSRLYSTLREGGKKILARAPAAWEIARRTEEHAKGMVSPGTLFEELGLNYIGPVDGHNLPELLKIIKNLQCLPGPQLLHVLTVKGKGYSLAEENPVAYHAIAKHEPQARKKSSSTPKYQSVFGEWLCDAADRDERLVAITPAMCEGSGMIEFARRFPKRFYDVAIAEQHALTLAAGLACGGMKPVVAIYSTFLQRAYDQLIHDIALQNLDVLLAIDRAGLVGEDGPTHAGAFDLSFMRCIPNLMIMAPSDAEELRRMLETGHRHPGPAAVRYPRGAAPHPPAPYAPPEPLEIGRAIMRREGRDIALLCFGALLPQVMEAAETLDASVADMRFVKPLDKEITLEMANRHRLLISIEDNVKAGGGGDAVAQALGSGASKLHRLGLPDRFVEHASRTEQLSDCGLDASGIIQAAEKISKT